MKRARYLWGGILLMITLSGFAQVDNQPKGEFDYNIRFERTNGRETSTYEEMMAFYKAADTFSEKIKLKTYANTDKGLPLQVMTYKSGTNKKNALDILINNGIHPGEPDGIDASMLLIKDLINNKLKLSNNVVLHIIPAYNLGGMINRNTTSRANQNGPKAYGFRGNARNYDLNRDFIKMDTDNMRAFAAIYHDIKPDVYVETHVSNGADYQYTLTHLFTQHNRLGDPLGDYLNDRFKPQLEQAVRNQDLLITPYVNVFGRSPYAGFSQFLDSPRYSTGYTALWNTLGMLIETHMLKTYNQRVIQTRAMLESIIQLSDQEHQKIKQLKAANFDAFENDEYYSFDYQIDSTDYETLKFKGYKANKFTSEVTGKKRLKYDRSQAITKKIPYFNKYKAGDSIRIPDYYVIPAAWKQVISRLKHNQIQMHALKKDSLLKVESYQIENYKTADRSYEGHYLHKDTKVSSSQKEKLFRKGDYIIPTNQSGRKYILEVLEPELKDSFFNWNFFDSILQRKEGFSAYVFEDYAVDYLAKHPELKKKFDQKKANNPSFRENHRAQLNWIYKQTPLYEDAHLQYPIYRMMVKDK